MFGHFDTMYVLDQLPLCCVPSVKFTMQLFHGLVFLFVIPFLTSVDDLFDDSRNERGVIVAVAA